MPNSATQTQATAEERCEYSNSKSTFVCCLGSRGLSIQWIADMADVASGSKVLTYCDLGQAHAAAAERQSWEGPHLSGC